MSKKYYKKNQNQKNNKNSFLTKVLLCIIILLSSLIYINFSEKNHEFFKKTVLESNINFSKLNKFYNKYFGSLLKKEKDILTFNETLTYKNMKKYKNGYELTVDNEYMVPFLSSGIIVFIGEKDNFGNTVIVQGNNGIDVWYGNVNLTEHSLYDYVSEGSILGVSKGSKIYLDFIKDGKHLTYEEYTA